MGIIGTGWVGSSVAISTLHAGLAKELLLHDVRTAIAEGEAMDLAHGAAFYPAATVRHVPLDEMRATDAVVIAAGRGGRAGESRLDLARDNAHVVRDIASHFRDYAGVIIVVTNPVDVLTYDVAVTSGLPHERVIGTGTMLDTARLRQVIGTTLHVAPQSIHGQVIGEHGDSEVVLWSSAQAAGVPLRHWPTWSGALETEIASQVRRAAYEIIQRKGATNHAIGLVTAALLSALLRGENRALTVSRVQDGALGLKDVALSLSAIVGTSGAAQMVEPERPQRRRRTRSRETIGPRARRTRSAAQTESAEAAHPPGRRHPVYLPSRQPNSDAETGAWDVLSVYLPVTSRERGRLSSPLPGATVLNTVPYLAANTHRSGVPSMGDCLLPNRPPAR